MADDFRSFSYSASGPEETAWLVYRHIVPTSEEWQHLANGQLPPWVAAAGPGAYRSQLITDFNAYNSGLVRNRSRRHGGQDYRTLTLARGPTMSMQRDPSTMGANWCGDLVMEGELTSRSTSGIVSFRLIKGGIEFLCEVDLATGMATVSIPGVPQFEPVSAQTVMRGAGTWPFRFANVDEQMRLWVNNREIAFPGGAEYDHLCEGPYAPIPRERSPNYRDLTPSAIGAKGANAQVRHLRVKRDIYYIAVQAGDARSSMDSDLRQLPPIRTEADHVAFFSDPSRWGILGRTNNVTVELGPDRFFMLGDNSAKSKDSRLWVTDTLPPYVHRNALIGQAVAVYWPHGWPIPGTNLHFVPNFQKMRFIE